MQLGRIPINIKDISCTPLVTQASRIILKKLVVAALQQQLHQAVRNNAVQSLPRDSQHPVPAFVARLGSTQIDHAILVLESANDGVHGYTQEDSYLSRGKIFLKLRSSRCTRVYPHIAEV